MNTPAAQLNNNPHHMPVERIRRAVNGPFDIKEHEAGSGLNHALLLALDAIGNIPFGGLVWAHYLSRADWKELAAVSHCRIVAKPQCVSTWHKGRTA